MNGPEVSPDLGFRASTSAQMVHERLVVMNLSPGQASLTLKTSAPQGSVLRLRRIQQLSRFHFRLIANEKTSHL